MFITCMSEKCQNLNNLIYRIKFLVENIEENIKLNIGDLFQFSYDIKWRKKTDMIIITQLSLLSVIILRGNLINESEQFDFDAFL